MKKLKYFVYYLKNLDLRNFVRYFLKIKHEKNISSVLLLLDIVHSSFRYNISILEFFQFRFYDIPEEERFNYAGTGFMYEYQMEMNPRQSRDCMENKILFLNKFSQFIHRIYADQKAIKNNIKLAEEILTNPSGKFVLKLSTGQCGRQVEVCNNSDYDYKSLIRKMKKGGYDLVEEFVQQHPLINELSPSGLNTVRIITQYYNESVIIIAARLRISVNSVIDNMAGGNLAAPVNIENGIVTGSGVYSDIMKEDAVIHPVTLVPILGFRIPFWEETIELIKIAASSVPENKSIGWDVAITGNGPELIEGNHNWCKLLWQLPVKKGLKKELEKYR
jgi:hypothetical protein